MTPSQMQRLISAALRLANRALVRRWFVVHTGAGRTVLFAVSADRPLVEGTTRPTARDPDR